MRRKVAAIWAAIAASIWPALAGFLAILRYGPDLVGLPGMVDDAGVWYGEWIPWLAKAIEPLVYSWGIPLLSIAGIAILLVLSWPEIRAIFKHSPPSMQRAEQGANITADDADRWQAQYKADASRQASYGTWSVAKEFHLWEVACLWVGTEPVYPPPAGPPSGSMRNLKMAICTRKLGYQSSSLSSIRPAAAWLMGSVPSIDDIPDNTVVTRGQLRAYAEKIGERPRFLFDKN